MNYSVLQCDTGVIDGDKFDIIPTILLPIVFLAFIVLPFFSWKNKRLRVLEPKLEEKGDQNHDLIHREILTGALLMVVVAVYGVIESAFELSGRPIGIEASSIVGLLFEAWTSNVGNGFSSFTETDPPSNETVNNFFEAPLRLYSRLSMVKSTMVLIAAILMCIAAILCRREGKQFYGRGLACLCWIISTMAASLSMLVPYAQHVPYPDCSVVGTPCTSKELDLLFALERQIVGIVFGLMSLFSALPYFIFLVPVWVRTSKLIVLQKREVGSVLYFAAFPIFWSLATMSGFSVLAQSAQLFSVSTSLQLVWIVSTIHLTPFSTYKNWAHFVLPFYLSLIFEVLWFALVTPVGCVIISYFSTNFTPWYDILLRSLSVVFIVVHFLASIFLTNSGVWFFFEVAMKKAKREHKKVSSPLLETTAIENSDV